jgi:hypothetical protein
MMRAPLDGAKALRRWLQDRGSRCQREAICRIKRTPVQDSFPTQQKVLFYF